MKSLSNKEERHKYEEILTDYTKKIISTTMHSEVGFESFANDNTNKNTPFNMQDDWICVEYNSNHYIPCSDQSLRNLRLKRGCSEFGNKNIVQCLGCESS